MKEHHLYYYFVPINYIYTVFKQTYAEKRGERILCIYNFKLLLF